MPLSVGPPPTLKGGHEARAPIRCRGSTTRSIGRRDSDSSPVSSLSNSCAASSPASSRIVVPELPQSRDAAAARKPRMPRPVICESWIETPRSRRHAAVDCTSAPGDRPRTWLSPDAMEPRMRARCEIDLSPGRAERTVAITASPSAPVPFWPPRTARPVGDHPIPDGAGAGTAPRSPHPASR